MKLKTASQISRDYNISNQALYYCMKEGILPYKSVGDFKFLDLNNKKVAEYLAQKGKRT